MKAGQQRAPPILVGVAGGSGSGKTTVVNRVVESLGCERAACIQHDSYYRDQSQLTPAERADLNYDHPDALETSLLVRHLKHLLDGVPVEVPVYDFANHVRTTDTVRIEPLPVILLDGILVLAAEELRRLMTIRVYVDTDADLRFIRRMKRDLVRRSRTLESVLAQYTRTVRPMHLEFVEPSKRYADVIISEGGFNELGVGSLIEKIESILNKPEPDTPL